MSSDRHLSRIPPMTSAETIAFYTTGKMPERFRGNFEADRTEVLRQYGVHDTDDNIYFGYGTEKMEV